MRFRSDIAAAILVALLASLGARADTTHDCSRFALKFDPKRGEMVCAGRSRSAAEGRRDRIQEALVAVRRAIQEAEILARVRKLTRDQENRFRALMSGVGERLQEIKRVTERLRSDQEAYRKKFRSEQEQRVLAQRRTALALEQRQRQIVRSLTAEVRERSRQIKRRRVPGLAPR